uniref:Uncharacterized protein n=1 Tax=Oryza brachyantha TaxID=4533 RepID=J3M8J6_ORYBR
MHDLLKTPNLISRREKCMQDVRFPAPVSSINMRPLDWGKNAVEKFLVPTVDSDTVLKKFASKILDPLRRCARVLA